MRLSSLKKNFFIVVWNILFVVVVSSACEFSLRIFYDRPHALVRAKYYSDKIGDFEPNIRVVDDRVKQYPYHFTTNSQGIRSLREIDKEKPGGVVRILCLGDSFTMGWGVDDKETYPELLYKILSMKYPSKKFEVINAGNIFTNILDEIDYYNEKGASLNADLVVLQFYSNDIYNEMVRSHVDRIYNRIALVQYKNSFVSLLHRVLENSAVYNYLAQYMAKAAPSMDYERDGNVYSSYVLSGDEKFLDDLLVHDFVKTDKASNFSLLLNERNLYDNSVLWDNYGKALKSFSEKLKKRNTPLLFVSIPSNLLMYENYNAPVCYFSPLTLESDINYIDFSSIFRDHSKNHWGELYLQNDGHTNPLGNTLIATVLADSISVDGPTPGKVLLRVQVAPFQKNCQDQHRFVVRQNGEAIEMVPPDGILKEFSSELIGVSVPTDEQMRNGFGFFESQTGGAIILRYKFNKKISNFDMLFTKNILHEADSNNGYVVSYSIDNGPLVYVSDDKADSNRGWVMEKRVVDVALPNSSDNLVIRFDFNNKAGLVLGNEYSDKIDNYSVIQFYGPLQ